MYKVWRVEGDPDKILLDSKDLALQWAFLVFRGETGEQRHSRITCEYVFTSIYENDPLIKDPEYEEYGPNRIRR